MAQDQLCDHAGGNRDQQIVAPILHPLVATGRTLEAMAMPIIDHIVRGTELRWHACALDPVVLRPRTQAFGLTWRHAVRVPGMRLVAWRRRRGMLVLRTTVGSARCRAVTMRAVRPGLRKSAQGRCAQHDGGERSSPLLGVHR